MTFYYILGFGNVVTKRDYIEGQLGDRFCLGLMGHLAKKPHIILKPDLDQRSSKEDEIRRYLDIELGEGNYTLKRVEGEVDQSKISDILELGVVD